MKDLLQRLCDAAVKRGASFAEARVVEAESTGIIRQDGRADKLNQSGTSGLGVRVLKDGAWGFASVSDVTADTANIALDDALNMAEASSTRSTEARMPTIASLTDNVPARAEIDPRTVKVDRKMAALGGYEQAAQAWAGDKLANSIIGYYDRFDREIVCNSYGTYIEQEMIRTFLHALIVARDGSVLQRGKARVGACGGFELVERTSADEFSVKAAKLAVSLLTALPPPAGKFPVVFHPSITGLLTHEAVGHNAEADSIINGTSIISGRLGERIGSELVTIIDDSTIPDAWGSYKYDSEGTPGERRVLIDKGVLTGFMHSLETAAKMGVPANGSARAQSYNNRPIVRMSNTFIQPGASTFEEMIRDIDRGIYLKGGEYGYVFAERGQFTCHAGEAYMIRNGELAEQLRDVSVTGLTLEALMNIDMVGKDFEMKMPGMCGKDGQGVPVDNGGPHIRIRELVVGGRV
jgi:TldD protein